MDEELKEKMCIFGYQGREKVYAYNMLHSYADCIGTAETKMWCDFDKKIIKYCIEILAGHMEEPGKWKG